MKYVLDLFCGCGGFSNGFEKAGFRVKYAIDIWKGCKETYEYNHPNTEFILADVRDVNPEAFKNKCIYILLGSPPCKEFSRANNNPDPNKGMELVLEYIRWIKILNPKFWIMENVPDIVKFLKSKIVNFKFPIIKIINSANYGIPQARERCFAGKYKVPNRTHHKNKSINLFGEKLEKWQTVWDAIKDTIIIDLNQEILSNHSICMSQLRNPMTSKGNSNYYNIKSPARTITTEPHSLVLARKRGVALDPNHKDYRCDALDKPATGLTTQPLKLQDKNTSLIYRKLTVREHAKLQSFPDDFLFFGSKSNQFRMVGNAVPPLLSYQFAKTIKNTKMVV